jgi:hypothetical protein
LAKKVETEKYFKIFFALKSLSDEASKWPNKHPIEETHFSLINVSSEIIGSWNEETFETFEKNFSNHQMNEWHFKLAKEGFSWKSLCV